MIISDNQSVVYNGSYEVKRFKVLKSLLQIVGCFVIFLLALFFLANTAKALPPPTAEEIQEYTEDGTLEERVEFAQSLGNADTDKALVQNFKFNTASLFGKKVNSQDIIFNYCMPSKGNVKVPVLIVDFSDAPYTIGLTNDEIQQQVFGGNADSLTSFYKFSSYNQLSISGDVMGVYRAKYPLSHYKAIENPMEARQTLAKEVLTYFDQQGVDYTQYDSNGDHYLDSFYILWNGPTDGWGSSWYTYKATWRDETFKPDGLNLYNYVMYSVDTHGGISNNVLEHETGHLLGLPDYYSYDMSNQYDSPPGGLGGFDMMDYNRGDHNIFSKYLLGWVTPQSACSGSSNIVLKPAGANPSGLIIMPNWNNSAYSEYFMAEYLTKAGNYAWCYDFDSPGLRIFHIDAKTDSYGFLYNNSYTEHKLIRVMEADGLEQIEKGVFFGDEDLYRTGQTFSPDTFPNSDGYGGAFTGISLTDLSTGGATASLKVSFVSNQAKLAILRTFPADGTSTAGKTSRIQVIYNNSVYKDTGFAKISLTCLRNGVAVDITCNINKNILTVLPASPLSVDSQYSLNIPANAVRNAAGMRLGSPTNVHFSTPKGASTVWGHEKTLTEIAKYLETTALCPMPGGGALVSFWGRNSDNKDCCGFLKTDIDGNIIWYKIFPEFIDDIVNSCKLEQLQGGEVLVSSSNSSTLFSASMEPVWTKSGKAFTLSNGNIGFINITYYNTSFSEYTLQGDLVSQKEISSKNRCDVARTLNGYLVAEYDYYAISTIEFIEFDTNFNQLRSMTYNFSNLPTSENSIFYFPEYQTDDCIRLFRVWDISNISVIKLGWDASIINETQVTSTADISAWPICSEVKTDGTVFLAYSDRLKRSDARILVVEKILPDNAIEWRKDIEYSNGNIDCTGFISSGATTSLIANTYLPAWCFRTIWVTGPVKSYTVTFNSIGGSPVGSQTLSYNDKVFEPIPPIRPGYTFIGWFKENTYKHQWDFYNNLITGDMTLFAKWKAENINITVLSNNVSFGTVYGSGTCWDGASVTIIAEPKPGYRFIRWTEGGKTISTNAEYTFTATADRTLTAEFGKAGTPSSISAVSAGYNSIKVSWGAGAGASGYLLYRSTSYTGKYSLIATTSSTSYTNSGLSAGTKYYYKVCAYITAGWSKVAGDFSAVVSATPILSQVTGVKAAMYYPTSIKVSWGAVSGRNGYVLERSTSPTSGFKAIKSTTSTYYKNTGLTTNTKYYYRVRAYRKIGKTKVYGPYSAVVSDTPRLAKVTGVKASVSSATKVKISWKSVSGKSGYEILRSTSPTSGFAVVGKTTRTYWYNSNITPNTTYYYKVRAYRTISKAKKYGEESTAISARPVFATVSKASAKMYSVTSIKVTWKSVSGRKGYEIWRSESSESGYAYVTSTTKTYNINKSLVPNKTYYYRIRAYVMVGKTKYYSGYSNTANAMPVLGPVTGLIAKVSSSTSCKLTWKSVSGRSGYEILRSTSLDGTYSVIKSTTKTYYYDKKCVPNMTYYYKVRAYVTVKGVRRYSPESAAVSVTLA